MPRVHAEHYTNLSVNSGSAAMQEMKNLI